MILLGMARWKQQLMLLRQRRELCFTLQTLGLDTGRWQLGIGRKTCSEKRVGRLVLSLLSLCLSDRV